VRTPQDLVGKVVGLNQVHDLLALAMDAWLDRNGVDRSKVQFVEVPPRSMMPGLESKRLDAAFHLRAVHRFDDGARREGDRYAVRRNR